MNELLLELKEKNIDINVEQGKLKLKVPKGLDIQGVIKRIKENETELISLIEKRARFNGKSNTIERAPAKEAYQLSSAQKRLYILHEYDKASLSYNNPSVTRLKGALNKEQFSDIFNKLVKRHEILRTSIELVNNEPIQKIAEALDFEIEYFESDEKNAGEIIEKFVRPFDLSKPPLMRVGLIKLTDKEHLFLVDMHHIIADAASSAILMNDFMALYEGKELPELGIQYKDYAEWQQSAERQEEIARQEEFWLQTYAEIPETPQLPTDFSRPLRKKDEGDFLVFEIGVNQTNALKEIAKSEGATLFMMVLSFYNILLAKLSNQEDIVIGIPVGGRQNPELENIIGMFTDTLSLRNQPKGNLSFRQFLSDLRTKTLRCFENQDYPFEELVDKLQIEKKTNHNPLFDVWFAFQNFEESTLELPGISLGAYESANQMSKFDLTIYAYEDEGKLLLNFEYSTELFKRETMERFASYFQNIASAFAADPEQRISEISMLPPSEEHKQLYAFNEHKVDHPEETTFLSLFAAQVQQQPDALALECEGETLTYKELDDKSNFLAGVLKEKGIGRERIVGLMLERSIGMVTSILGILKAGGAYLPIDVDYPQERKSYLLQDSGADLLLTTKDLTGDDTYTTPTLLLEEIEKIEGEIVAIEHTSKPSDLCYIIYTSGSTGHPKGVMIEHSSLVNYISWGSAHYLKGDKATFALYSSISFDLTVTSIFLPLITGNKMVIYNGQEQSTLIVDVFKSAKANVIKLTPSHLKLLRDGNMLNPTQGKRLKLIVGGEELESALAKDVYDQLGGRVEIYNEYGPTEATVGCMIHQFTPDEALASVPIGHPIDNTQIYILDKYQRPVATGVEGELYISGAGVARGYLSNEALTAERFVENPFIEGTKMYRTGDLGLRRSDGSILFKGRSDDQVKLRGYRIELSEIEYQLAGHALIQEAVVLVREQEADGSKDLVAYYLAEEEIAASRLKRDLSDKLPDYMLPPHYVHLKEWPLTTNGKLDKKSLPDPEIQAGESYVAPRKATEEQLVSIWSSILGVATEELGVNGNFFVSGGDSMKAIRLVSTINKALSIELSLHDLFQNPSVALLSEFIENSKVDAGASLAISSEASNVALRKVTEEQLVSIWSSVLGVATEELGVNGNFFVSGGDSMKAIRLVATINKALSIELSLHDLFENPSVALLSEFIANSKEEADAPPALSESLSQIEELKAKVLPLMEDKAHISDVFPMSDIEKGMVYHSLSNIEGAVYHDQGVYNMVYETFDLALFEKAMQLMVEKHSNLRKSFNLNDYDVPLSVVYKQVSGSISCSDISLKDKAEQEQIVTRFMEEDRGNPFDFHQAPLWRIKIFKTSSNDICLLWIFHHSIMDGWSSASLMTELNNTYLQLLSDSAYRPEPLKLSYKDFVVREIASNQSEKTKEYWKKELDEVSGTEFRDLDAVDDGKDEIGTYHNHFSQDFHKQLVAQSKVYNVGVREICFAAYLYARQMLTYDDELLVGLVTNNRPVADDGDKILGCFLNTIPFRINIPETTTCKGLVSLVNSKVLETREHQQMSLFEMMNQVNQTGFANKRLFNAIFTYIDFHIFKDLDEEDATDEKETQSGSLNVDLYEKADTDLEFIVSIWNDSIHVAISFSKSRFGEEYVQRLWSYFERVMHSIVQSPEKPLGNDSIISSEEKEQLLFDFNPKSTAYPKEDTLTSLLEKQAKETPENIALVYNETELSYEQLNERANQLAHYLRAKGVSKGSIVGLMIDRSVEMIIGMIGILKAGGAYLPLDITQPEKRIKYVLNESNALVLLTDEAGKLPFDKDIMIIDVSDAAIATMNKEDLETSESSDLAYIIYTSGSTGKPNGVMVAHHSVINLIHSQQALFGVDASDRILQFSTIIFDASVEQIWLALLSGSSLILIGKEVMTDNARLNEYLLSKGVTHLHATPSFLENIDLQPGNSLRRVISGGEECKWSLAQRFKDYQFYNEYGPTETTVTSVLGLVPESTGKEGRVAIGKPVNNTFLYVLGNQMELLPRGVKGELYIGGEGLAHGYVNNAELTQERFVDNPFRAGELMYKTGDSVRWLPDGNLDYLGRLDDQVKIRGFRIELGEIEHQLSGHAQIGEAVVVVREKEGEKHLVAYYISKEEIEVSELREYLSDKLPDYMLPAHYLYLEQWPLTDNGKLDKKALPDPEIKAGEGFVAPSGELEEQLAELWAETLKLDKEVISVNRSFFELGGHSLNAGTLANKIHKSFNVDFSIEEIFTKPTIAMIAKNIEAHQWVNEASDSPDKKSRQIII